MENEPVLSSLEKMKRLQLLLLGLLLAYASCSNPCKEISCQNGGECLEGVCDCAPGWVGENCQYQACYVLDCQNGASCSLGTCHCLSGFYGEACEYALHDRFIGTYAATQNCQKPGEPVSNSQYDLLITAGGNGLEINLYLDSRGWVTADIEDYNNLTIPDQDRLFGSYAGSGMFVNDSTIHLNYFYNGEACEATLIRQ